MATAARADAFTGTVGVQIHLDHSASQVPYSNLALVEQSLAYLNPNGIGSGVGTVRDETWAADKLGALGQLGYGLDIYESYGGGNNVASSSINAMKPLVDAGYVRMVEGPLEVDNGGWGLVNGASYTALNGSTYSGWQAAVKMQQDLYTSFASKTDVALFSLAVPSDGHAGSAAVSAASQLGLKLTDIAETGNVHFYPHNGTNPKVELAGTIADETGYTAGRGFTITETGLNDAVGAGVNVIGTPAVNSVYTLDLFLDAYKAGSKLTDYYELFDENMGYAAQGIGFEDHWGLFNSDGTPKPAATSVRNMMAVLGDNGAAASTFTPGSVNYSISGLGSNGNSLLMQKSNGAFELAVWASPTIYQNGNLSSAPTQNVTVNLGAAYSQVRVYDPTKGTSAVQTLSNASTVSLAITDHPLIIELPSASTLPTTPTDPPPPPPHTQPQPVTVGSGANALAVKVSEDAYNGDAQFTVSVDGTQIGGTQTTTASHASGQTQTFTFKGNWSAGQHAVAVNFLNDAYGGSATTDRNLYVTGMSCDGTNYPANTAALLSAGPATFTVSAVGPVTPPPTTPTTPQPVTVGSGSDSLVVMVNEDAYNGDAQFTVSVDGTKVGGTQTTTASHASGQTQAFTFKGEWSAGQHTVAVAFLNDAYGGSKATDRNLYVTGMSCDGTTYAANTAALTSSGTASFKVNATDATPPATTTNAITVNTGQTVTVPTGNTTVTMAGTSETVTAGASGADTFVFTNTSPAVVNIKGFKLGTDKITAPNGLHDFANTSAGVDMWLNDGTHVTLAGLTNAAAAQVMTNTTNNVMTVYGGQNVTTQAGFTDTVNVVGTGNATVNVGGKSDTINCNTGTDTITVTAGNVTVNGSTGGISFVGGGSGTATLNLKGGSTTATFGNGGAIVNVAGKGTFTGGLGAEVYNFIKDASIDTAVINNFAIGTDHLHLSGYGTSTAGVASIADASAGVSIKLTDGSAVSLVGVHNTTLGQIFN